MKAYCFTMESVLGWREDMEKTVSEKYTSKNDQVNEKNQKLERLSQEYHQIKEETMRVKSAVELQRIQTYKNILSDEIDRELGHLNRLHVELEEIHTEWTQARKEKTTMEKLKERDFGRYKEKLKNFEQHQLDEAAISRHYWKEG